MDSAPLYIFLHIHKTGGTTLIKHLEKNFHQEELFEINHKSIGVSYYEKNAKKILTGVKKKLSKRGKDSKKIKVVYGHIVPYGVHKLFERDSRYFVFFRDPVGKLISSYNYYLTLWNREPEVVGNKQLYEEYFLVNGKVTDFYSWVENKLGKPKYSFALDRLSKYLHSLGYLANKNPSKESVTDLMRKFWFTGTTETLDKDLLYIYDLLGINKYFVNQNTSNKYFTDKEGAKKFLKGKLDADFEIYKHAVQERTKTAPKDKYKHRVKRQRIKRALFLPFTQILLDPMGTAVQLKHKLMV